MKKIVSMGRGGSGKTSFIALITKCLIENGKTPLLLVDVDPDQNLDEAVGISLRDAEKKTISELLIETFIEEGGTTVGITPSDRIESRIWEKGLFEGEYFDYMAVGPKWLEGCYCLPDASLKRALERLIKTYEYVLIDSPAGLEHLNRKITAQVNDIYDVIDPSSKSLRHIKSAYRILTETNIDFKNFYVIKGYRFSQKNNIPKKKDEKFFGEILYDDVLEDYLYSGKSLLDLPDSSIAYKSVKKILRKAKYI